MTTFKKLIIKTWKMKKNRKVSYQNRIKFVSGSQDRINEGGLILSKYDGIIKASGLQNAKLGELVFVVRKTGSKISNSFFLQVTKN